MVRLKMPNPSITGPARRAAQAGKLKRHVSACLLREGQYPMSKTTYLIAVIRKRRDKDYFDFWTHGLKTNESGEELCSNLVGVYESVDANNKQEAILLVKKKHQGLSIDTEVTQRLG